MSGLSPSRARDRHSCAPRSTRGARQNAARFGEWQKLTTYCESDVINTWLVYLRYQRLLGQIDNEQLARWEANTRDYLKTLKNSDDSLRHEQFLQAWGGADADMHAATATDTLDTETPMHTESPSNEPTHNPTA